MSRTPDDNNGFSAIDAFGSPIVRKISADGELWIVREVSASTFDRRGGTHLVFESATVMRRLRSFPTDWFTLSDEDLYTLSCNIRQL